MEFLIERNVGGTTTYFHNNDVGVVNWHSWPRHARRFTTRREAENVERGLSRAEGEIISVRRATEADNGMLSAASAKKGAAGPGFTDKH